MVNEARVQVVKQVAMAGMLALVLGSGGPSALAQDTPGSLDDFRLPPGPGSVLPTPTPTADPSPTTATPVRPPSPSPSATAAPAPPAAPAPRPSPRPAPTTTASPPAAVAPPAEASQPARAAPAATSEPVVAPASAPPPVALPTAPLPGATAETVPAPAPAPEAGIDWKVWAALILALLAATAWYLRDRLGLARRTSAERQVAETQSVPAAATATASPPAALPSRPHRPQARATPPAPPRPQPPVPSPPARPAPTPNLQRSNDMLQVTLSARRLSATLLNTTLSYELVITNQGEIAVGPLAVTCDMIGAHASLPARFQLENPGQGDPNHRIPQLGPGESATIGGELRLPLTAITPIRHGEAALFVPLARFRILAWREGRPPVAINRTFVIGETPPSPDAALKPFRLDLGPRMYSSISQREVALPA